MSRPLEEWIEKPKYDAMRKYAEKLEQQIDAANKTIDVERRIGTELDHPQLRGPFPIVTIYTGLGMGSGKIVNMVSLSDGDAKRIVHCHNNFDALAIDLEMMIRAAIHLGATDEWDEIKHAKATLALAKP